MNICRWSKIPLNLYIIYMYVFLCALHLALFITVDTQEIPQFYHKFLKREHLSGNTSERKAGKT